MKHSNFVGNQEMEAAATDTPMSGPLVALTQNAGSMHFMFSMTPEQARALAADLIALADRADRMLAVRNAA